MTRLPLSSPGVALWVVLALGCGSGASCSAPAATPPPGEDPPEDPAPVAGADVTVEVDTTRDVRPISPWVYGVNRPEVFESQPPGVFTFLRSGGNRLSAYDWETNDSNAAEDVGFRNDGDLFESTAPGALALALGEAADQRDAALLLTLSMLGRVAADRRAEDGDIRQSPNHLETRMHRSVARCPNPVEAAPNPDDDIVCQDQYVAFVERARGAGRTWWSLDNEPSAWPRVHAEVRSQQVTYAELLSASILYAGRVRDVAPDARIFGPALFGWPAYVRLTDAPDANDRDFLAFYLDGMRGAGEASGRRLLDVLDLHWYPDVSVDGTSSTSGSADEPVASLRTQLPRSLYDPAYREPSWIVNDWLEEPVNLLPRLQGLIDAHYPGTDLAITEYCYGGGTDISGAVAQADTLGALGRLGVFAAAMWPLYDQEHSHLLGAFHMYRRLDADGTRFGDRSAPATVSDLERASAWASLDSEHDGRVVIVLIARGREPITIGLRVRAGRALGTARVFRLDPATARPVADLAIDPTGDGAYRVTMPGRGIATLVIDAR